MLHKGELAVFPELTYQKRYRLDFAFLTTHHQRRQL